VEAILAGELKGAIPEYEELDKEEFKEEVAIHAEVEVTVSFVNALFESRLNIMRSPCRLLKLNALFESRLNSNKYAIVANRWQIDAKECSQILK
jgi:hypothetical protein